MARITGILKPEEPLTHRNLGGTMTRTPRHLEEECGLLQGESAFVNGCYSSASPVDILEGHDWELRAQVALWIAAGAGILVRMTNPARVYIQKSCEGVDAAGLQFIPTYDGLPPELSEDLHEKLSIHSQITYFGNFLFLTCSGAGPVVTARVEKEFKHKLQVRPASLSLTSRVQRSLIGSVSGIVQDSPVDHAHASHFAGQRHGGHRPTEGKHHFIDSTAWAVNCVGPTLHLETIMRSIGVPPRQPFPDPMNLYLRSPS